MKELKAGLSGFMRAKNESQFIGKCIDSCINALDELIVVYNDCTDDTPEILKKKAIEYPGKIKVYKYPYKVLAFNLNEEEYRIAKTFEATDPRLFCNQCNYALSLINYQYAIVIDPDQIYFEDEILKWRDVCSMNRVVKWRLGFLFAALFSFYVSIYRRLSQLRSKPLLWMMPLCIIRLFQKCYQGYAMWRLQKGTAAIALSGVNLFWDSGWYVTFDNINISPPYNGASDHLIFKLLPNVKYIPYFPVMSKNTIAELLCQPNKIMFADNPAWFHQHANRRCFWANFKRTKQEHEDWFVPITSFARMSYQEILSKLDADVHTVFQLTSFLFVHVMGATAIEAHLPLLHSISNLIVRQNEEL